MARAGLPGINRGSMMFSVSVTNSVRVKKPRRRSAYLTHVGVDAGAQVVQLKILLGRGLAFIDLLRPLLKRYFDPECLVDRKRDVEKIQAVDAEIVDGVAFRFDRVTRNVAGLGDDIGDGVKSRRHQ